MTKYGIPEVDSAVTEFSNQANIIQAQAKDILKTISDGCVPSRDSMSSFDLQIEDLRSCYDKLMELAKSSVSAEKCPANGDTVHDIASIIVEFKKQLNGAKETLQKFISVKSCVDSYTQAIIPYQSDAQNLLDRLSSGESIDSDKLTGPNLFVKAIESSEFTTDEGQALLEEVSDYYSGRVLLGLQNKKYYIPKEGKSEFVDSCNIKEKNVSGQKINSDLKSEESITNTNILPAHIDSAEVSSFKVEQKAICYEDNASLVPDANDNANNSIQDFSVGQMISPIKKFKINSTPSATAFKHDIAEISRFTKDIFSVLPMFTNLGALTEQQIYLFGVCMSCFANGEHEQQKISDSLNQLVNKGMLAMYTLSTGENVYCLTPNCSSCLKKETVRQMKDWRISFGDYHICGKNEMCESYLKDIVNENENLLSYFRGIKSEMPEDKYYKVKSSIKHIEGGYLIGVFAPDYVLCSTAGETVDDYPKLYINEKTEMDVHTGYLYQNGKVINLSAEPNAEERDDHNNDSFFENNESVADNNTSEESAFKPITESHENDVVQREESKNNADDFSLQSDTHKNALSQNDVVEPLIDIRNYIYELIVDGKTYCASAYAKAALEDKLIPVSFYSRLAYAINDPFNDCEYLSDKIFGLMEEIQNSFDYSLIISASMRTFFSNQFCYDYQLKALYAGIKDFEILQECPSLSKAMYSMSEFKINQGKGMDAYADYRLKNARMIENNYHQLQKEAEEFYCNYIQGKKKESANNPRFVKMKQHIFSPNGEIGQFLKAIIDGQDDFLPLSLEFLRQNFFEDDSISEKKISSSKMDNYINSFWEKAQEGLMVKHHVNLVGGLRNNIINATKKAVQLIVRWCDLVERKSSSTQDNGSIAYKSAKKGICEAFIKAFDELDKLSPEVQTKEQRAGLSIVKQTAHEIFECISGKYDENNHRFFYSPFLLSNDVCLTDEYLPDMDMHGAAIPELMLQNKIRHFAAKTNLPSYTERMQQIIDNPDDNYGTAKLLINYCSYISPSNETDKYLETIRISEEYAKKDAENKKDDFVGELEFAQANGKIDSSTEDTKEIILKIVINWYEWAQETGNYGIFKNVLAAYLKQIEESAKKREKVLLSQLKEIKNSSIDTFSPEEKEQKISKIKSMISEQKYTAAEDLINRFSSRDESDTLLFEKEKDFLADFIDNYEFYKGIVKNHQSNFSRLVSKGGHTKESKQAKELAENWLPGGSDLGQDKLKKLLNLLGFKIRRIDAQPRISIGKTTYENYFVYTELIRIYSHPISAFGTGAASDGFRIVCMTGIYNSDQLISIMKQIGNAKHTLVLLDDALEIAERRRLARKTKQELGDKFIGVLDRVVMMYLVRNFDQTHNTRMLLSLVMPFGYYQPYVPKSVDPMPPELFIGRKKELETIESRSGANIVYGGRQLGKSALLKRAKEDIDKDENGDRAVYISIKGQTFDKVAQKIGQALYDCGILTEDPDTTDWNELSRCLNRRLQSSQNPIPYLLLLLDEADTFIESSETIKYAPFDSLKDIQETGKFKFVVAGVHNVVRFKREAALGGNSVLPHLGAITVKPFSYPEARELLEVPLYYLGLRFQKGKDSESLISTILSSTNYFPGLIQMYCVKLLQAMRENNYAGYDEADSPIYKVSSKHIKKVLADMEFTREIREKFEITLREDQDKYYEAIALIMAYLYHKNGYSRGYDAEDIRNVSKDFEISKISELSIDKLNAFLEELKDLNIFRNTDETHYLFTRFNFYQMMGSQSEVEDKLLEYMEG